MYAIRSYYELVQGALIHTYAGIADIQVDVMPLAQVFTQPQISQLLRPIVKPSRCDGHLTVLSYNFV